ncbi:hypothetical protein N9632_00550 [bacterium]|nr:hypothetical protein [bacterium]
MPQAQLDGSVGAFPVTAAVVQNTFVHLQYLRLTISLVSLKDLMKIKKTASMLSLV